MIIRFDKEGDAFGGWDPATPVRNWVKAVLCADPSLLSTEIPVDNSTCECQVVNERLSAKIEDITELLVSLQSEVDLLKNEASLSEKKQAQTTGN